MNNYTSSSEKKLLESPEKFTSIKLVFLIYSPCFIALVFAMLCAILTPVQVPTQLL